MGGFTSQHHRGQCLLDCFEQRGFLRAVLCDLRLGLENEMIGDVKSEIYVEMANAGDYEVMMLGRGKMTGKDSKARNMASCKRLRGALAAMVRTTRPLRRLTGKQTVAPSRLAKTRKALSKQ